MSGRKLEEADWSNVYCAAKGIPEVGWSNLNIDVIYNGIGIEHKMLKKRIGTRMRDICGTRQMHPSATRSIRIPLTTDDADSVMREVLSQYRTFLEERSRRVSGQAGGISPDMRTGWLLWEEGLREFLYFEEETIAPDPADYYAEWRSSGGGTRKSSRNIWVFERETGIKRYSITTLAGAKVQPYFDVPSADDPNVYLFRVQSEQLDGGQVRLWITPATERELRRLVGETNPESLSVVIASVAAEVPDEQQGAYSGREQAATPLVLTAESYQLLTTTLGGVSDEDMIRRLVHRLRSR